MAYLDKTGLQTFWTGIKNKLASYLPLSGGTLTGAINTANNTWNTIGDNAYLGDSNQNGCVCIKGKNSATGLYFVPYSGSTAQKISVNGSGTMTVTGTIASTFSGALTGNVTGNCSGSSSSCTGNASTATAFSASKSVELTGDVTGSASSTGGWSVATTIEKVTDAQINALT